MSSRKLRFKHCGMMSLTNEMVALRKSAEIVSIIHSAYQSTEKVRFTSLADQHLMRRVHYVGFTLSTFINCSCRGHGVPATVLEAFALWKNIEQDLRKVLIDLEFENERFKHQK